MLLLHPRRPRASVSKPEGRHHNIHARQDRSVKGSNDHTCISFVEIALRDLSRVEVQSQERSSSRIRPPFFTRGIFEMSFSLFGNRDCTYDGPRLKMERAVVSRLMWRLRYRAASAAPVPFLVHSPIQSRNELYQSTLFCGFRTQWPSSGNSNNLDGTFWSCNDVKSCSPCV